MFWRKREKEAAKYPPCCEDCRWYKLQMGHDYCIHPIFAIIKKNSGCFADTARHSGFECGPKGKLFEAKPT